MNKLLNTLCLLLKEAEWLFRSTSALICGEEGVSQDQVEARLNDLNDRTETFLDAVRIEVSQSQGDINIAVALIGGCHELKRMAKIFQESFVFEPIAGIQTIASSEAGEIADDLEVLFGEVVDVIQRQDMRDIKNVGSKLAVVQDKLTTRIQELLAAECLGHVIYMYCFFTRICSSLSSLVTVFLGQGE